MKAQIKNKVRFNLKEILGILIVSLACLIIYLPSFKLNFSLLDDGATILHAQQLVPSLLHLDMAGLAQVFLEPLNGRIRPGYWLIQSIFSWLSLYNPHIFHFLRFLSLVATLIFTYVFMKKLNIHYSIILFSILVFLFSIQNFENYYQLGPVEPLLILTLVIIFYLIFFSKFKKKLGPLQLGGLIVLGSLMKENFFLLGLAFLPALVIVWLQRNKALVSRILWVVLFSLISGGIIFAIKHTYPSNGVYASNYNPQPITVLRNLWTYTKMIQFYQTPLFELSIVYLLFFAVNFIKRGFKKTSMLDLVFITFWSEFLIQLIVLSPWAFALNRYLAFVNIDLIFIYAISLSAIISFLFRHIPKVRGATKYLILGIIFMILFSKLFIRNFFALANYQLYAEADSEISYGTVKDLADKIPLDATVYVNYKKGDSNLEIYEEAQWHLAEFYRRSDINFEYLDSSNLCTKQSRFIFDRSSDRLLDPGVFSDKDKFTLVSSGVAMYDPVNYGIVMKSFIDRYRYTGWDTKVRFDWALYKQKGGTCIEKS